jgi:predicted secreted protein
MVMIPKYNKMEDMKILSNTVMKSTSCSVYQRTFSIYDNMTRSNAHGKSQPYPKVTEAALDEISSPPPPPPHFPPFPSPSQDLILSKK